MEGEGGQKGGMENGEMKGNVKTATKDIRTIVTKGFKRQCKQALDIAPVLPVPRGAQQLKICFQRNFPSNRFFTISRHPRHFLSYDTLSSEVTNCAIFSVWTEVVKYVPRKILNQVRIFASFIKFHPHTARRHSLGLAPFFNICFIVSHWYYLYATIYIAFLWSWNAFHRRLFSSLFPFVSIQLFEKDFHFILIVRKIEGFSGAWNWGWMDNYDTPTNPYTSTRCSNVEGRKLST